MKSKICGLLLLFFSLSGSLTGQQNISFSPDSVSQNILRQLALFPQEKLHLHIDKTHYISGEKIWFRAHLIDALSHRPALASRYVYVELINPIDSVVNRTMIRQTDSLYYGHINLPEDLAEGNYTIRAYTNYMWNLGDDYFFKKNIYVSDPLSGTVRTDVNFNFSENKDKVSAEIRFIDIKSQALKKAEKLRIQTLGKPFSNLKTDKDSIARTSFKLTRNANRQIMLVEFDKHQKYIEVPQAEEDYDVSFYPEGGHIIDGQNCCIAFKSLNTDGLSEDVTGELFDSDGEKIGSINTLYKGMGYFNIMPESDKSYYAVFKNNKNISKRIDLPQALKNSYALKLISNRENRLLSVINSFDFLPTDSLYIVIHLQGLVKYAGKWDHSKKYILFNQKDFPSGVLQILLLDSNMNPLSERLFFNLNEDQASLSFSTNKENYGARELITSKTKISDNENNPLSGSFSISVTDDKDVLTDTTSTILSSLLLTSELRGHIESPAYYFMKDKKWADRALDALMLTQGWRRYNIPEAIKKNYECPTEYIEIGQEISGTVKGLLFSTKPIKKSKMTIFSPTVGYFDASETDNNGRFRFNGFEYPDSTTYFVQALSKKGSSRVELFIDQNLFPAVTHTPISSRLRMNDNYEKYIAKADLKYTYENGMRIVYLDEVVVTGRREEKNKSMYSGFSDYTLTEEQIENIHATRLEDLLMRIPGIQVNGNRVSIRNSHRTPLFVIDDMPINDMGGEEEELSLDFINVADIAQIEILRGASASIFGSRGGSGVILITTKRGDFTPPPTTSFNIKTIKPKGYQKPAEFYSPKYETKLEKEDQAPDLRTTIYWKPDVKIPETGETSFEFYSSDASTTYSVVIEGITSDGKIIRSVEKISRK